MGSTDYLQTFFKTTVYWKMSHFFRFVLAKILTVEGLYFGSSIRAFKVTTISVVKFLLTCIVFKILKDKEGQKH